MKSASLFSLLGNSSLIILALAGLRLYAVEPTLPGAQKQLQEPKQRRDKLPDLGVHYIGLSPTGSVIYQVVNSGKESTKVPFVVEIYLNGVLKDTIRHEPLPAMSLQTVESRLARLTECKDAVVRVVVDAQNSVPDLDKKNNERSVQLFPASPPCPKAP